MILNFVPASSFIRIGYVCDGEPEPDPARKTSRCRASSMLLTLDDVTWTSTVEVILPIQLNSADLN